MSFELAVVARYRRPFLLVVFDAPVELFAEELDVSDELAVPVELPVPVELAVPVELPVPVELAVPVEPVMPVDVLPLDSPDDVDGCDVSSLELAFDGRELLAPECSLLLVVLLPECVCAPSR